MVANWLDLVISLSVKKEPRLMRATVLCYAAILQSWLFAREQSASIQEGVSNTSALVKLLNDRGKKRVIKSVKYHVWLVKKNKWL